ncbi:hypothetical protein J4Q44_G00217930 [Coregonus suidteri]|uniref:TNFR-Cys domain-containing protein n=1 Tax=Coregonus suidteri TaxID=861788 RepID=A0AAN8LB54_9TELE
MCSPGNRVHKHCTEFTSTSCVPCSDSTFLDEPNGLTACILCTNNCDPGFGLTVKQPCRPSSDTVCGTLEGFYCLDPTKDGCRAAQRHSSCKPGQYISHTGTTSTDTVCADCPEAYHVIGLGYKFLLTLSVIQVTCERSFSTLKFTKHRLRSTLILRSLGGIMLMTTEKEILMVLDTDDVIDRVAEKNCCDAS